MSNKEKESAISLTLSLLVTIPYLIFVWNKFNAEAIPVGAELQFWASAILLLIPVKIISLIIGYIIISIVLTIAKKPVELDSISDERDRLIELKAVRNSSFFFYMSLIVAMIIGANGHSIAQTFMTMLIGGFLTEIIEHLSKFYYYQKGV